MGRIVIPGYNDNEKNPKISSFTKRVLSKENKYERLLKLGKIDEFSLKRFINNAEELVEQSSKDLPEILKKIRKYSYSILAGIHGNLLLNKGQFILKAHKATRNIHLLSSISKLIGYSFKSICIREIQVVDGMIQDYVKQNPKKSIKYLEQVKSTLLDRNGLKRALISMGEDLSKEEMKTINNIIDFNFSDKFIRRMILSEDTFHKTAESAIPFYKLYKELVPKKFIDEWVDTKVKVIKEFFKKWRFNSSLQFLKEKDKRVFLVNKKNPLIFTIVTLNDDFTTMILNGEMERFAKEAIDKYEKEKKQEKELAQFDLPKNKRISHIRIFPKNYDQVISNAIDSSSVLAQVYKNNYPKLSVQPILFTEKFSSDLTKRIERDYKNGVRYFNLDIYSHGTLKGFMWKGVSAKSLITIFQKFPAAEFNINTVACHGAGLITDLPRLLKQDPSLRKRIRAFTQTKSYLSNMLGVSIDFTREKGLLFATPFYIYLTEALMKGRKFGEALVYANKKIKETFNFDAEAIIDGKVFVENFKRKAKEAFA